jgi:hypothetical protein
VVQAIGYGKVLFINAKSQGRKGADGGAVAEVVCKAGRILRIRTFGEARCLHLFVAQMRNFLVCFGNFGVCLKFYEYQAESCSGGKV